MLVKRSLGTMWLPLFCFAISNSLTIPVPSAARLSLHLRWWRRYSTLEEILVQEIYPIKLQVCKSNHYKNQRSKGDRQAALSFSPCSTRPDRLALSRLRVLLKGKPARGTMHFHNPLQDETLPIFFSWPMHSLGILAHLVVRPHTFPFEIPVRLPRHPFNSLCVSPATSWIPRGPDGVSSQHYNTRA